MTGRTEVSREQLERDIRGGEIDTVLMVFPDLQGRLTGKRTTGRFFLESVADAGTENCDYLIACDMDNNPVPGYRFTSYEQGYGDMLARADWNTVRRIPWVDKTAMIMCDLLRRRHRRAGRGRAAHDAAASGGGRRGAGLPADGGQRDRVLPVPGHLRRGLREGLSRPAAALAVARGLPHPADDEGRVHPRRDPPRPRGRRRAGGVLARARPAGASTR